MRSSLPSASVLLVAMVGCGSDEPNPRFLPREALLDPETCAECHAEHVRQWSGSMHAYAALDPVFLAMNARGQRETNGALGDFCVSCHAPMAVRLGLTTDGLNLSEVPSYAQGVTCYFCHSVSAVEGEHNAPLVLADDGVLRGGIAEPVPNGAHASAYSELLDREQLASATLCGSCHDIVTPAPHNLHLERTFEEWRQSLFSNPVPDQQQTCGNCHMAGRDGVAADFEGVFLRRVHDHKMVGVDVALTPFPEMEAQRAQIQRDLDTTVRAELCVVERAGETAITVGLENQGAGHGFPSGAAQDRRVWVELTAYDATEAVVFESGVVAEGEPVTAVELGDPNLWRLGDRIFGEAGQEVHMFWEAASVESELLMPPTASAPSDPAWTDIHRSRTYLVPTTLPARVTLRVLVRPMGLDVLQSLVDSGDLDEEYLTKIPTFSLGLAALEWTATAGVECIP